MFNTSERIERIRDFIKYQKTINTVQKQMGSNTKYSDLVYNDIYASITEARVGDVSSMKLLTYGNKSISGKPLSSKLLQ